jgi:hypothetical protein
VKNCGRKPTGFRLGIEAVLPYFRATVCGRKKMGNGYCRCRWRYS